MESFLNLLWVAIAAGVFCLWRTRWLHERPEHRRNPLGEWAAFACAFVILFFAVSLTDDLHSGSVVFDECGASRRHAAALSRPHNEPPHRGPVRCSGVAEQYLVTLFNPLQVSDRLLLAQEFSPSSVDLYIRPGRAPPTLYS